MLATWGKAFSVADFLARPWRVEMGLLRCCLPSTTIREVTRTASYIQTPDWALLASWIPYSDLPLKSYASQRLAR